MAYDERIVETIQKLTGKKNVLLTKRCNTAIMLAMKVGKQLGYTSITIPDVGGWMTYEQFAVKLKLPVHKINTDDGKIDAKKLKLVPKTMLFVHSLAGYHWKLDTKAISSVCKRDDALFVEDICGSVGEPVFGDIVVCSFGAAKPVNFGTGGFFATDNDEYFSIASSQNEPVVFEAQALLDKLTPVNLEKRKNHLFAARDKLRTVFEHAGFIVEGDSKALVLIIPYSTADQQKAIEEMCVAHHVEWTVCPRYIRSKKQAISVEIKRL